MNFAIRILFRPRFETLMFLSSSAWGLEISWIDTLILFCPRFRVLDDFITFSLFHTRSGVVFPFSSARDLGWFRWIDALPLFRTRFRVFDDFITSPLFHTRFEVIFLSSSARDLEWFCSSFARGSKMIIVKQYFYPLPPEVWSWSLFIDTFILFRTRCWLFIEKWYFYPLSHEVWSWPWFTGTVILFCTRFEVDL